MVTFFLFNLTSEKSGLHIRAKKQTSIRQVTQCLCSINFFFLSCTLVSYHLALRSTLFSLYYIFQRWRTHERKIFSHMLNKRDRGAGKVVDLEACQTETRQRIGELSGKRFRRQMILQEGWNGKSWRGEVD